MWLRFQAEGRRRALEISSFFLRAISGGLPFREGLRAKYPNRVERQAV
jgi:hypothetical protein